MFISSRANKEIISVALLKNSKERQKQRLFIAEGSRAIKTLLNYKIAVKKLYALEDKKLEAQNLCSKNFISYVSEEVFKKISNLTTPSGLLAVFYMPEPPSSKKLSGGLVLANITTPGNAGTIIRTCAALGIHNIYAIDGVDVYSPKVVQASVGEIGAVNIHKLSWQELIKSKGDLKLCALVVKGGNENFTFDLKNTLVIVGNEANGLPIEYIKACDQLITLPMPSGSESLNAALAVSITLYLNYYFASQPDPCRTAA